MNRSASRLTVLAAALLALASAPAFAVQDNGPPPDGQNGAGGPPPHGPPDPQHEAARLARKLGLTPDQTSRITAILQNQAQQMAALRSAGAPPNHEQMRSIRQQTQAQISALLTPAQQQQYAAMLAQMHNHQGHGGGGGDAGGPPPGGN